MSVADAPGIHPVVGRTRVRDLLRQCGSSHDPAERWSLLAQIADELDQAAAEIVAANPQSHPGDVVAGLRGQASMARFIAEIDRPNRARQVS